MKSFLPQAYFILSLLCASTLFTISLSHAMPPSRQFYQLVVYHLGNRDQENHLDQYLSEAYIPAAHRMGIKVVGVFKTANIDMKADKRIYVLIPYSSLTEFHDLTQQLEDDHELKAKSMNYQNAAYDDAPYIRKETILLEAFSGMPVLEKPEFETPKKDRIYELRSYESATEKLFRNKVQMFNKGEIDIFKRIGSQAVFYGEVLAGSRMPNLMYMTSYRDKASRDEHWNVFRSDPEWQRMSALPEYQHNTSKSDIMLLVPTTYSDL